jgi:hypothetical protein
MRRPGRLDVEPRIAAGGRRFELLLSNVVVGVLVAEVIEDAEDVAGQP